MNDTISRKAAINALGVEPLAYTEYEKGLYDKWIDAKENIEALPSAQAEGWLEKNKKHILQAGKEGREVEFYIGGRLFRIREVAQ